MLGGCCHSGDRPAPEMWERHAEVPPELRGCDHKALGPGSVPACIPVIPWAWRCSEALCLLFFSAEHRE